MSWSLGEVRSLSIKAAKGAGFSWGEAEEAGFAVEWLEARCAPGVEALARYLSSGMTDNHCPIRLGCKISDLGEYKSSLPMNICQPLLIAPFIANTLQHETLLLSTLKCSLLISRMDVFTHQYDAILYEKPTAVLIEPGEQIPDISICKSRVEDTQKTFVHILERLAHKTYAPATEQSRIAGAGAGTTDND